MTYEVPKCQKQSIIHNNEFTSAVEAREGNEREKKSH